MKKLPEAVSSSIKKKKKSRQQRKGVAKEDEKNHKANHHGYVAAGTWGTPGEERKQMSTQTPGPQNCRGAGGRNEAKTENRRDLPKWKKTPH